MIDKITMRRTLLAFVAVLSFAPSVSAVDTPYVAKDRFPLPKSLETAVNFWIDVYSKYHTNEYVIHDDRNLGIIYEVVSLGDLHADQIDLPKTRQQRNLLKNKRRFYRSILLKLASSKTNYDALSQEEIRVKQLFGEIENRRVFRTAAGNVRAQRGQRDRFYQGLKKSGRYMDNIRRVFRSHGLPEELTVIPHVESSFNYKAYSTAGAAGIWQITRPTGRRILQINYEIDERLDPILATEAAAKLLKNKFEKLGSWPLAITAYNHGLSGMLRAKRKLKTTDISVVVAKYRSRYFGFASRNFYCEFLAALHVATNYQDYFGTVEFETGLQFQEFPLPYYSKLSTLAQYFNLSVDELRSYNPALRNPIIQGSKYLPKRYRLRLPLGIEIESLFAAIPKSELFVAQKQSKYYRVRRGDTVGAIARRFRTTIYAIMQVNNMESAHKIRIGEVLHIPQRGELASLAVAEAPKQQPQAPAPEKKLPATAEIADVVAVRPPVKTEQLPVEQSGPANEPVELPANANRPKSEPELLLINTDPQVGMVRIEPEETLGHFAEWLRVPTQKVREWNNLDYGNELHIGQQLRVEFERVSPNKFVNERLEYHRGLEDDFFSNFKVIATSSHTVQSGESIWYLCNQVYRLPLWLIKSYNNDLDFYQLKPGDQIVIPEVLALDKVEPVDPTGPVSGRDPSSGSN